MPKTVLRAGDSAVTRADVVQTLVEQRVYRKTAQHREIVYVDQKSCEM